jgi:hypothetical protein
VSSASVDVVAPKAVLVDVDNIYGVHGIDNVPFEHTYVFDEPVEPDSSSIRIGFADEPPAPASKAAFEPLLDDGYLVGFRVDDVLSDRAQVTLKLQDLAGNEREVAWAYPGVALEALDGTFETKPPYLTSDDWSDGVAGTACEVEDGYGARGQGVSRDLTPIAGAHSFLVAGDRCTVFFRLTRPPGSTRLRFDARVLSDANLGGMNESVALSIGIASLAIGGDAGGTTLSSTWPDDPELSTPQTKVSQPQMLSIDLPESGDDFLISFQASRSLWLDSLRLD